MNGADSSIADPYLQQFVFDNFENVAIKPEIICQNSASDGNAAHDDAASTAAPTPSSGSTIGGLPEDELLPHATPDSVIMSHPQITNRLPPMPLPHSQTSPPPHLLTPPESQMDHYPHPPLHHHHHHPMMSGGMIKNCNLIIPGTLPDTPPISSSPTLPTAPYHHLEHHHLHQLQYPQLQPLHHLHPPADEVVDDMLWLSQPADMQLPRQEPLDLRPHCNGDSIQNWNMMQQHTSVITGPGKRIFHTDYFHHEVPLGHCQANDQLQTLGPLLATSSNSSSSASSSSSLSLSLTATSTKSLVAHNDLESQARYIESRVSTSSSRNSTRGRSRNAPGGGKIQRAGANSTTNDLVHNGNVLGKNITHNPDLDIEDDLLLKISVRDLNVKLKGTTKDKQTITKQRRRTLKNRIYAQNCRNKRNVQKNQLETTNQQLEQDLKKERLWKLSLQNELNRVQNELAAERQMTHNLRNKLDKLHSDIEILDKKLAENAAAVRVSTSCNLPSGNSSANLATNLSVTSSVGDYH